MTDQFDLSRRSALKASAGALALAMGGGTPFLSSKQAFAAGADLAKQQLRTIGLSVTVQERILADYKAATGVGSANGTAATFPDAQTKILSGSKDFDCWETIGERLPAVLDLVRELGIEAQCAFGAHVGQPDQKIFPNLSGLHAEASLGYLSTMLIRKQPREKRHL